jgi:hypothetical protein
LQKLGSLFSLYNSITSINNKRSLCCLVLLTTFLHVTAYIFEDTR